MLKRLLTLIFITLIIAGGFIGFRMATAPSNLSFSPTYSLPDFVNLEDIFSSQTYANIKYAIAIDGTPVYANSQTTQPAASTAKMILALMVIDKKPFELGTEGGTITITPEMYSRYTYYTSIDGSTTPMTEGSTLSEYDALATTMLPSSNNMADSLAIWAFGDLDNYRTYATDKLKEWGINDTIIGSDASGFSDSTTSTASDLAKIGHKLMENPTLAKIVGLSSYNAPLAGTIENTNKLLGTDNIIGVKTGYIGDESGYCLVVAYLQDGHIITIAALNADTRAESFVISQDLVEKLQQNLTPTAVLAKGQEVGYYDSWWTGKVEVAATEDASVLGWSSAEKTAEVVMNDGSGSSDTSASPNPSDLAKSINSVDPVNIQGTLKITIGSASSEYPVESAPISPQPSLWQRFLYAIGQNPLNK